MRSQLSKSLPLSGSIESAEADFGSWMELETPARSLRVESPELTSFFGEQAETLEAAIELTWVECIIEWMMNCGFS